MTLADLPFQPVSLSTIARVYLKLRAEHPRVPAIKIFRYITSEADVPFEQFNCRHEWAEDDTGRMYCLNGCGLDGDG